MRGVARKIEEDRDRIIANGGGNLIGAHSLHLAKYARHLCYPGAHRGGVRALERVRVDVEAIAVESLEKADQQSCFRVFLERRRHQAYSKALGRRSKLRRRCGLRAGSCRPRKTSRRDPLQRRIVADREEGKRRNGLPRAPLECPDSFDDLRSQQVEGTPVRELKIEVQQLRRHLKPIGIELVRASQERPRLIVAHQLVEQKSQVREHLR